MRKLSILFISLFATACNTQQQETRTEETNEQQTAEEPVKPTSRYTTLLSKFTEKSFDTLHLTSPAKVSGELIGNELDSSDAALLPQDIFKYNPYSKGSLYAVYQFNMSSDAIGLIARTPAMYRPSSIKFFRYDKKKDSITSFIELAENWGDGGDLELIESWIYRDNGKTMALKKIFTSHDPSVEGNYGKPLIDKNTYTLLALSSNKVDTISTDSVKLKHDFEHLLVK